MFLKRQEDKKKSFIFIIAGSSSIVFVKEDDDDDVFFLLRLLSLSFFLSCLSLFATDSFGLEITKMYLKYAGKHNML